MPYIQTFGFSRTSSVVGGNSLSPLNKLTEEVVENTKKVDIDPEIDINKDEDIIVQNNEKSDEEYSWGDAGKDILSHSWGQFKGKDWKGKLSTIMNPSTFIDTSINPEIDKKLDTLQNATTLTSFGAGATGAGEVASLPMDVMNSLLSFKRAKDIADDVRSGDRTDVASKDAWKHAGYGIWHGAEAIPFIGTAIAGTRLASLGMKHMPKTMSTLPKLTDKLGKGWSTLMNNAPASVQKVFSKGKGISTSHQGASQAADVAHGTLSATEVATNNAPTLPEIKFPTRPLVSVPSFVSSFGPKVASFFSTPNEENSEEITQPTTKKRMTIPSGNPMTIAKRHGL